MDILELIAQMVNLFPFNFLFYFWFYFFFFAYFTYSIILLFS